MTILCWRMSPRTIITSKAATTNKEAATRGVSHGLRNIGSHRTGKTKRKIVKIANPHQLRELNLFFPNFTILLNSPQ